MQNTKILNELKKLTVLRQIEGDIRREYANKRAIDNIEAINWEITSGDQAKKNISGIGFGLSKHIDDILSGNGISELNNLSSENKNKIEIILKLEQIHGIGFKTALAKYEKGDYDVNTTNTIKERIPRKIIKNWSKHIFKMYAEKYSQYGLIYIITGSYRRKQETSGDIDILIYIPNKYKYIKNNLIEDMKNDNILTELSSGENKFEGYLYLGNDEVRIDMMFIYDKNEYPYSLLYFTGNKVLNIKMRSKARKMGYHLTNTEMLDSYGDRVIVDNEYDIFDILEIPRLTPEERNI